MVHSNARMSNYCRKLVYLGKRSLNFMQQRSVLPGLTLKRTFAYTSVKCLKEIKVEKKENVTVIEGVKVESSRKNKTLPTLHKGACPLCQLNVKYTDVLILSQFISPHGDVLPQSVTSLCDFKHKKLQVLVQRAQDAGLLAPFQPDKEDGSRADFRSDYKWKKYNIHFTDEKVYPRY